MRRAIGILAILSFIIVVAPLASAATFKANAFGTQQQELPRFTPQLADQITGFFEWALRVHFNRDQRARFQQQLAAVWARRDEKAIENFVGVLASREQMKDKTPEQQAAVREKFEAVLVEALRKSSADEMSQFLLAVYDETRKLDQVSSGPIAPPAGAATASQQVPAALVGEWRAGSSSSIGYVSPGGSYAPPSGTQVSYKIFADGHYEYASLTQQSSYNCTTKLFLYKVGVVALQGDRLTFIPKSGSFTSEDNCNARFNYKKPATLEQDPYQWRIERDQYGQKLCLNNGSINGCAYKQ